MADEDCMAPKEKRKVMEMLQVKVMISKQNEEIRIEGWFGPPIEGLSYTTLKHYARQPTLPPGHA